MADSWFKDPEVLALLEDFNPIELKLRQITGDNHFEWVMPEYVENIFDKAIDKVVDRELGYSFGDKSGEERELWIRKYESQVSPQTFLNTKFGDPNVYWGLGLTEANRRHKLDPGYPLRVKRIQKDMNVFLDQLGDNRHGR